MAVSLSLSVCVCVFRVLGLGVSSLWSAVAQGSGSSLSGSARDPG